MFALDYNYDVRPVGSLGILLSISHAISCGTYHSSSMTETAKTFLYLLAGATADVIMTIARPTSRRRSNAVDPRVMSCAVLQRFD